MLKHSMYTYIIFYFFIETKSCNDIGLDACVRVYMHAYIYVYIYVWLCIHEQHAI